MKKSMNGLISIKRIYFPPAGIYLLFALFISFLGFGFLNHQYTQRLKQLGNITGAVLSEDPSMESTLLSAMQDTTYPYLAEGFATLKQYGYRESLTMYEDTQYRSSLGVFLFLILFFLLISLIIFTVCFHLLDRNRKLQEKWLQNILEQFLSEDYSFLENTEEIRQVYDESFLDTFLKLGHKLRLKTQALSEERDNTKTLVTDISHQLKTPVSALKNCLTMSMEAESIKEQNAFLQRCALQLTKLESLMEALINISRLETSMITLHQEKTSLSDILIDAVNTVYVKAMQKDISVEVINPSEDSAGNPEDSSFLFLDRKWTAEALVNILDNAVKYSPAGSTIMIRIHMLYTFVRIEIEDAGIGIPKEEYNKIFKRFYRGPHPVIQHSEGSGVGLYLSRKIFEEQGGSIMVKPALRQGSIFVVQLPLNLALQ